MAQMPDGRAYLWVARTVGQSAAGCGAPGETFAIGLGRDLRHVSRPVYSRGIALTDPAAANPIGAGCKVCERSACPQRAFPLSTAHRRRRESQQRGALSGGLTSDWADHVHFLIRNRQSPLSPTAWTIFFSPQSRGGPTQIRFRSPLGTGQPGLREPLQ